MVLEADSIMYETGGREILHGAFLNCHVGEIVGVLGRNGSGKSTLFEILFGTRKTDNAFVRIGSKVLTGRAYRSGLISYMPQFNSLPPYLRVKTVLWTASIPKSAYLNNPTFKSIMHARINELSGGESKYLELFVALNTKSPFVLLDEPFTGMSPIVVEAMVDAIQKARNKHGIIISDHNYKAVNSLSDRLMFLTEGRIQQVKDIVELKEIYYR